MARVKKQAPSSLTRRGESLSALEAFREKLKGIVGCQEGSAVKGREINQRLLLSITGGLENRHGPIGGAESAVLLLPQRGLDLEIGGWVEGDGGACDFQGSNYPRVIRRVLGVEHAVLAPREDSSGVRLTHEGRKRINVRDAHGHEIPSLEAIKRRGKVSSAGVRPGLGENTPFPPAVDGREIYIGRRWGENGGIDQGMSPPGVHKANTSHGRIVDGLDSADQVLEFVGVNKHMEGFAREFAGTLVGAGLLGFRDFHRVLLGYAQDRHGDVGGKSSTGAGRHGNRSFSIGSGPLPFIGTFLSVKPWQNRE
jgi:hypothetical protein